MKRFCKKENLGITLIALVITIVVLIILATVAIQLSLGKNGIFNRAKTAKEQYTNAQEFEQGETAGVVNKIDNYIDSNRNTTTNTIPFEMIQLTNICYGTTWQKNEIPDGLDQYRYLYIVHTHKNGNETYGTRIVETNFFKEFNSSSKVLSLYFSSGSNNYCSFYYNNNNGKDEIYIKDTATAYGGYVCGIK